MIANTSSMWKSSIIHVLNVYILRMRTVKLVNDKILMCTVLYEKKIFSISMCILLIMCYVNQIK